MQKKERPRREDLLYVGEILKNEGIKLEDKTLLLSTVGSGKTTLIKEIAKQHEGLKLLLVSTTTLKEHTSADDEIFTVKQQNARRRELGITGSEDLIVMTYAELGERITFKRKETERYSVIFCDEIHSLFEYFTYKKSYKLYAVIHDLLTRGNKTLFFTATDDKIKEALRSDKNLNELFQSTVKTIDLSGRDNIMQHFNAYEEAFSEEENILEILDNLKDADKMGAKIFIYEPRITKMLPGSPLITKLEEKGFNPLCLWSVHNTDYKMDEDQLSAREELIKTGFLPKGYNALVINAANREGWNLYEKIFMAIINTTDKTDLVQARGRIRSDIGTLYYRSSEKPTIETRILKRIKATGALTKLIGLHLSKEDKKKFAEDLNVKNDSGRAVGFTTIKKALEQDGYTLKNIKNDGKYYTIIFNGGE